MSLQVHSLLLGGERVSLSSTPDWAPHLIGLLPVSCVDGIDNVHPLDDFSKGGESHPVKVPVIDEVDEDLSWAESGK